MKIILGVTTYNRENYVRKAAQSLYMADDIMATRIWVYDDCSNEYNSDLLRELFPTADKIYQNQKNMGADANMYQIFQAFLQSNDDLLVLADSDLIFHRQWSQAVYNVFQATDGCLSLYNSIFHDSLENFHINGYNIVRKHSLGAAGVILHREIVLKIIHNVPFCKSYDWAWSHALNKMGIRMLAFHNSLAQHLGDFGEHSNGINIDFGLNFYPDDPVNTKFLVDYVQEVITRREDYIQHEIDTVKHNILNSPTYRLGNQLLLPLKALRSLWKS